MDKDTKVLLMAVVIILVALVSFNLSDLTGKVTSEASVTVSPSTVNFGKYETVKLVTVKVSLGNERVDEKMNLYMCNPREVEKRMGAAHTIDLCDASTCSQSDLERSYSHKVYSTLKDGRYCFKVMKDNEEVAKSNRFTVAHV